MGDIALLYDPATGTMDVDVDTEADDLASDEGMRTAILLSLFLDRKAEPEDKLPGNLTNRRGHWADELAEYEGDRIGSRLWLVLERGKATSDLVPQVESYAEEALAWLVEDGVASAVDVTAELFPSNNGLVIQVAITRPNRDTISFRFDHVWNAEAGRAV